MVDQAENAAGIAANERRTAEGRRIAAGSGQLKNAIWLVPPVSVAPSGDSLMAARMHSQYLSIDAAMSAVS